MDFLLDGGDDVIFGILGDGGEVVFVVPALDGFFDDVFGFVEAGEFFNFGGAWFFQIFVMIEVEFDLLNKLLWQIFESLIFVAVVSVVFWDADNLVIDFVRINKFHDAEDASFHPDAGSERLVSNHEDIELVAIFIDGLRNEAIIARLGKSHRFDAVEHETSVFAVPFNLVIATGGNFDNDIQATVFVIAWFENFVKICHFTPYLLFDFYYILL